MDPSTLKFAGIPLLAWIPLLPFLGALINLTIGRKLSRGSVHVIAIASVAASCLLSAYAFYLLFQQHPLTGAPFWKSGGLAQTAYTWIEVGKLKVELAFRLDTLSAVMISIVTFVGTLIHIYSTGYMAHDPRPAAFFGYLNLFMGSMLTLVLGSNLPVMFIGWEGVGLCSFLLIGFWYENDAYAYAGRKAFVVNRIGDFFFLLGIFLLFWATKDVTVAGTSPLDFKHLSSPEVQHIYVSNPDWLGGERLAALAGIFLFMGAAGKSAQLPLFVWLPDAMAGPTPVSALIHAATMVTAGVYMVVRLSFLYSASSTAMIVVATVGLLTALAAAFMAFAQTDLKKVLAYSTVSQLGFMFVAAGTGNWVAAIFHLGTHAFFKACLFLGAGSVMHGMEHGGSTTPGDITLMGGLRKKMPVTHLTFAISCLAIAGIAPFSGFFSKDEILGGAWIVQPPGWPEAYGKVLWVGLLIAALGTAFYMWRLYFLVFGDKARTDAAAQAHESPRSMTGPLVVLAFLATVGGFVGLPHLHKHLLPEKAELVTHSLSRWLDESTAKSWYDPPRPDQPFPAASSLAPDAPCCCISSISPQGDSDQGHMTAAACAKQNGRCPPNPTKECVLEAASDSTTYGLMGIAFAIGVLGIFLAWLLYGKGPSRTVDKLVDGPLQSVYQASKAKLWFDEAYDVIIVQPFKLVARGMFEIVDRFIIDTVAVNGLAFVIGLFGRIARWIQNGQVQRYLTGLVLGAAAVFFVTQWTWRPTFDYERTGDAVTFHAHPGEGIVSATAQLSWDIDGNGEPDTDPTRPGELLRDPNPTVRAGDVASEVKLFIDDPVTRKRIVVERTIDWDQPREGSEK
jgi:NADH-quinone oxidoreductase subunit L